MPSPEDFRTPEPTPSEVIDKSFKANTGEAYRRISEFAETYLKTSQATVHQDALDLTLRGVQVQLEQYYKKAIDEAKTDEKKAALLGEYNEKTEEAILMIEKWRQNEKVEDTDKLDATTLARMQNHSREVAEILKNNDRLAYAFKFAIGVAIEPNTDAKSPENQKIAFLGLDEYFLNPELEPESELMKGAWTVLGMFTPRERKEYALTLKGLLEDQNPDFDLREFAIIGNKYGVFSPAEMTEIFDLQLSGEEEKKYGNIWLNSRYVLDTAEFIAKEHYGSQNAALEMLDLPSIAMFLGKVISVLTVTANMAVGMFGEGHLLKPATILKNWSRNFYLYSHTGLFFLLKSLENPQAVREKFLNTDNEKYTRIAQDFYGKLNSNPPLKSFLNKEDNIKAFHLFTSNHTNDRGELEFPKDFNSYSFYFFLDEQKAAEKRGNEADNDIDYAQVLDDASREEEILFDEKNLRAMMRAFNILQIFDGDSYQRFLEDAEKQKY